MMPATEDFFFIFIKIKNQNTANVVSPSSIAVKSNCLRCGSSVAPRKPIDALVAIILNAHTKTPGIFIKDWTVAREWNMVIE